VKRRQLVKWALALAASAAIIAAMFVYSPHVQGQNDGDDRDLRVELGFEIAPAFLNLEGKNRALVGLGDYSVNAVASCDDCDSAGLQTQFALGGNPYFGQPTRVNASPSRQDRATGLGVVPSINLRNPEDRSGLGSSAFYLSQTRNCLPPPFDSSSCSERLPSMAATAWDNVSESYHCLRFQNRGQASLW